MSIQAILGKKVGTTQVFREGGDSVCVTAVQAGPCTVTYVKTLERDGYVSVQLGYEQVSRLNGPRKGHLATHLGSSETLFRYLREVEANGSDDIEVGQQVDVGVFQAGDRVDAIGLSKGRGFAGGVKRHGFHGGPKTHGQSDRHRAPGSIGAGSTPGRVIKGHKMAGHMGNERVTVRNLEVVLSDPERNLLLVKGSVPGAHNSRVMIRKSGRRS
jgi:large subunit ribosomal protein L3